MRRSALSITYVFGICVILACLPVAARTGTDRRGVATDPRAKALAEAFALRDLAAIDSLLREGVELSDNGVDHAFADAALQGDTAMFFTIARHRRKVNNLTILLHSAVKGGSHTLADQVLRRYGKPERAYSQREYAALPLAARMNDTRMVGLLMQCWMDTEQVDETGRTAMMYASRHGNVEMMRLLTAYDASLHPTRDNHQAETLVYLAAESRNPEAVRFLLDHGAEALARGYEHELTCIDIAARHGDTEIVAMLIGHGISPDKGISTGKTPLIYAIEEGHYETTRYLLEQGAHPRIRYSHATNTGSPLAVAAANGDQEILTLLLDYLGDEPSIHFHLLEAVRAASNNGHIATIRFLLDLSSVPLSVSQIHTWLESAATAGQAALVRFWLDHGADPNVRNSSYGLTPLMAAAEAGRTDVARILIERGADVNYFYRGQGQTALMRAAIYGHFEVVKLLVENGADTDRTDFRGASGLMYAAERDDPAIAGYLLAHGACPDVTDFKGDNALMWAAYAGSEECTRLLLSKGFDPDFRNKRGQTPLMKGGMRPYNEIDSNGSFDQWVDRAIRTTGVLLSRGARINDRDTEGMTALMYAVDNSYGRLAEFLVANGADTEVRDTHGRRAAAYLRSLYVDYEGNEHLPALLGAEEEIDAWIRIPYWEKDAQLFQAIREDDLPAIRAALAAGADLVPDPYIEMYPESAMQLALECGCQISTLRLLVENGAWIHAGNENGTTALMRAVLANDHDAAGYFISRGADVNMPDEYGNTPLVFAAKTGDNRMIRMLAEHGAAINPGHHPDNHPLSVARREGHTSAEALLLRLGAVDPDLPVVE